MLNETIRQNQIKSKPSTIHKILKDLFHYYHEREISLTQLAYSKGATQKEIADALGVDPAIVSRKLSKKGAQK